MSMSHELAPDTQRVGRASGTRRRATIDAETVYRSAEATAAIASTLALLARIAAGPVSPRVLAVLPSFSHARTVALEEEAMLYTLARSLEAAQHDNGQSEGAELLAIGEGR